MSVLVNHNPYCTTNLTSYLVSPDVSWLKRVVRILICLSYVGVIRYARQKLVRRYSVTSTSSVIIFIIAPLSIVFLFTSTFAQFIKTHPLPTPKRHGVTAFFEDIRRHCASVAFPAVAEPKICENMRHEHVLSVHAWTRLELSTSSEPLHDRWLMRPVMVI